MFQSKNILFTKTGFDRYIIDNYVHFNYYNKYNRFIYKVPKIPKKEPRLTQRKPNTIYNTITNLVQKISTPVGSPEETSYLAQYKSGPEKDDIGWSCSIKSVQMLLAFYFKKWNIDFAEIGKVTDSGRVVIKMNGEIFADIPSLPLSEASPEYDRPWR